MKSLEDTKLLFAESNFAGPCPHKPERDRCRTCILDSSDYFSALNLEVKRALQAFLQFESFDRRALLYREGRSGENPFILMSFLFFVPLAISLLFSLRQPVFLSRNLIAASLGFYLLIAGTIGQFRSNKAALALLLPLILMNLISIGYNAWYETKEDWRNVAYYLASETTGKPGGLVVFVPGYA